MKIINKLFLSALASGFCVMPLFGSVENLLPKPRIVNAITGKSLNGDRFNLTGAGLTDIQRKWFEENVGSFAEDKTLPTLEVVYVDSIKGVTVNSEEAYHLVVRSEGILVQATDTMGVLRAFQTLAQLKDEKQPVFEGVEIVDWPAFSVRGFMHDAGRTYIPVEQLERDIRLLAKLKINTFHWHLTENQGWRPQSNAYPQLNSPESSTRDAGKFYTFEQMRHIEKVCRENGVELLPEIDMPGHSEAFKRAMGVDMQSDSGIAVLKILIKELCDSAFPNTAKLHIGTDEVGFTNPDFVPEMVAYVRSLGRKALSWNPGWKYKAGEIDGLQLWSYRGKFHDGIPAIDCRLHYANHFDQYSDVAGIYRSNICEVPEQTPERVGTILAFWNDRKMRPEQIDVENGVYSSVAALAERTWRGGGEQYITKSGVNLRNPGDSTYVEFADWERRFLHHKMSTFKDVNIPYVAQTNVFWKITDPFPNNGNLEAVFPPEEKIDTVYEWDGRRIATHDATGATVYLRHVWGPATVPAFFENPEPQSTCYAYTYVYSPEETTAGAQIAFQDYSRSEKDLAPQPGKWDYKGSRIWLNDIELEPPVWKNAHNVPDNEVMLENENFSAREPYQVNLKKGWNKIQLKLPVDKFSSPQVRIEKWMFTFVLTTPDGKQALPGIVYSPNSELSK